MKSRISIDIDVDNKPIIIIEYRESDDVRDKLVKRFTDSFQGGTEAHFEFIGEKYSNDSYTSLATGGEKITVSKVTPVRQEIFNEIGG